MSTSRILVIDDEQSILDLVGSYLRQEGYEVHTAMDGPGGLKAARTFRPDLIILAVWLVWGLFPHADQLPPVTDRGLSAREILDRRFARGEIGREEYDLMKETISNGVA